MPLHRPGHHDPKLRRAAPRAELPGYGFSCGEVGLEGVRAGNVADLCALLEWLVKYLPEGGGKTLVCIGDRIDAYEKGEDGDNLRTAMELLLGLARSGDPDRVVKVLATSPKGTVSIDRKSVV